MEVRAFVHLSIGYITQYNRDCMANCIATQNAACKNHPKDILFNENHILE